MANEYDALAQGNEYDDLIANDQKGQALRATMFGAVKQNPDEFAKATQLSRSTGLPPAVVARNLPDVESKARLNEYDALIGTRTGDTLASRPDLARLAHDDTETLAEIERTINRRSGGTIGGPAFVRGPWAEPAQSTERTLGGTLGDIAVTGLKGAVGLPQAFVGIADIPTLGLTGKGFDALGIRFNDAQRALDLMYSPAQQKANRAVQAADGFFGTLGAAVSNPSVIATTVGESLPQVLGGMTVARGLLRVAPSLSPLFAGAVGEGVVGAGSAAEQTRGETADGELTVKQAAAATVSGVGTAVFALMGGKLAQRLGIDDIDTALARGGIDRAAAEQAKKGFVRRLAEGGISEGVFEELPQSAQEQLWQNFAADRPLLDGVPNAAALGLLAGAVTGGAFSSLVGTSQDMQRREAQADAAQQDAQAIQQLAALAAASKLRTRDPQSFQEFVEAANEDGPVQDIYLDARTLQQAGVDPALLAQASPAAAAQIEEALASGGDIVIPVAEYAARIAGTDLDPVLTPHLRTAEDALSLDEAQRFYQGQAEEFQKAAAQVMEEKAADDVWAASAKVVEANLFEQLRNTGRFTDDVNTAYATLMRDFYVTTAARLGLTPEEMFARYPLQVRAERDGGAVRMEQLSPEQVMRLNIPLKMPSGAEFDAAVAGTPAARVTPDGLLVDVVRYQKPEQEGAQSVRTGVFYLPKGSPQEKHYRGGKTGYGGVEKHEGTTLLRAPLFVKGATGGKAPQVAYDQIKGKGAYEKMRSDVLKLVLRWGRASAAEVAAVLEQYGADSGLAFEIMQNSREGNTLPYAVQETIVAHAVRDAGYDAVVGYSKGKAGLFISEVFDVREQTYPARGMESQVHPAFEQPPNPLQRLAQSISRALGLQQEQAGGGEVVGGALDVSEFFQPVSRIPPEVEARAVAVAQKVQDESNAFDIKAEIASVSQNGEVDLSAIVSNPEYYDAENEEFTAAGFAEADRLTEEKARDNLRLLTVDELSDLDSPKAYPRAQYEAMKTLLDGAGVAYVDGGGSPTSHYLLAGKLKLRFSDHENTARDVMQRDPEAERLINVAPNQYKFSEALDAVLSETRPNILAQPNQRGNRGEISFGSDITQQPSAITLFANADLSTFLHEMGHFQLEVLAHIASQPNTPADIVRDMDAVLKWFGVADLATWRAMPLEERRPHHEHFARSFEAYLFEGRAPSTELESLFQRFRSWLISVYRSIKALNVEINDDIRGVMDRLLATDEAIRQAEAARSYAPLFKSAEEMGDAEMWAEYQRTGAEATQDAADTLQRRGLRDMQWLANARGRILKRLQKDAKAKREAVEAEVTAEVRAEPVYAAQRFLRYGEMDGEKVVGAKLDLAALKEMYGEAPSALWRYLSTGENGLAGNEGLTPDQVAEMFGFTSGDHLVREILAAPPEAQTIEGMTDQRVLERYGDLANHDTLARAADEAIHNEARARFVATELKALTQATGPVRAITKAAKAFAEATLARKQVKAIKPAKHTSAETRAARAAEKALAAGDRTTATVEKRNQIVQGYMARLSYDALDEIDKAVRYLRKFDSEGTRKNLDGEYLDQIDQLTERFDFRKGVSNKDAAKRESLLAWVESQREQGFEPDIPPELLTEALRKPYKELTLEELRGLVDTVKQIEHLGRLKRKLLTAKDEREFAAIRDEIAASIAANAKTVRELRTRNTTGAMLADAGVRFLAMHRKMASVAREMDGFADGGPMWEYFIRSMNAAGDREATLRADATAKLYALVKPLLASGKMGGKGIYFDTLGMSLNREERLAIALNLGNAGNMQRLLDGQGWTMARLQPVLATITAEEADFVQSVWDFFESYRPEIAAKERRIYGKEPDWVDPVPITLGGRQLKGGYYPIKYDPAASGRAEQHADAEAARQQMRGAYTSATTRRSFTKSRAEEVTGRPLLYSFAGIYQGANEVIHDLTWHEWLIDANRLLRALDGPIRTHYGAETVGIFKKAIEDIAAGDVPAQNVFEKGINHLRMGATVAGLGWNLSTALLQPFGLTQSMVRIGPAWVAKGLGQWLKAPLETGEEVRSKSAFMESRAKTMQREINEIQNQVRASKLDPIRSTFFLLIQKMQMVADMPTWLGAYEKAIAAGEAEDRAVALADQAVIDAQGGGQIKDLAQIQRGTPALKLWTNFYSFFNVTYNLAVEKTKEKGGSPKLYPSLALDYLLLFTIPAAMVTLLKAALAGEDDEDELVKKLVADQISYLLGTMIGLREVTAAAQKLAGVEQFKSNYGGPAGLRFFQEVDKLATQQAQGEYDAAWFKAADNVAGTILHYPSGQINRTVGGAAALIDGKTENPTALAFGPPRK